MISKDIYKRQIERIEGAFNYELFTGSVKVWKEELDKNHITDDDLIAGVNEGLNPGSNTAWKYKPSIADLLSKCNFEKRKRLQDDHRRREAELADKPLKDILTRDRAKSPFSQKLCDNLHDLFEDKISLEEFKKRDLSIKAQR